MATRMQQRRGTASQWTTSDPILAAGEIGFESDTNKFKVGDGVNIWSDVPYFVSSDDIAGELEGFATEAFVSDAVAALVGNAPAILDTLEELASAIGNDADFVTNTGQALADLGTANNVQATDIANINESLQSQNTSLISLGQVTTALQNDVAGKLDSSVAVSTYAPLSNATLSGTVSLPETTSIGDVSSTELGYVNGVTSAIQTQLNAKAPAANPTFTGTVVGVTKDHVGLGSVDNTSDASKPVSTDQATAIAAAKGEAIQEATNQVNAIISSAPAALNTLDELAAALGDDANFATTVTNSIATKAPIASPTFTGAVTVAAEGVVFTDGTQTKQGVPSITSIAQKTESYTLANLNERDTILEANSASGVTITVPADSTLDYPVGTTLDIIQTGSGQVTLAGADGVIVNATPGLKLRTQFSSATLLKRAANTWLVFGDLTA